MTRSLALTLLALAGAAACAPAEPMPPPAPELPPSMAVTDSLRGPYEMVKGYVIAAAEQVPEARFSYRPNQDVRTMGQLFGHVADANYMFCGVSSGDAGPGTSIEETATTKEALTAALGESFAFCDRAFAALNDETGADAARVDVMSLDTTRLGALALNTAHDFEHYGNIVTYMRMNNMVPPSTQMQQQMQQQMGEGGGS
jgi:uncharacterized damage-inducible protein DinB